jgi:hypothetical protein
MVGLILRIRVLLPFRLWIGAAAIMVLPTCALAQVQSGLQSGVRSGVIGSFDHRPGSSERGRSAPAQTYRHYPYGSCWRAVVIRGRVTRVWNCQPYPP